MKHLFFKRVCVFFLALAATCAAVAVDRACADMSAREEFIGISAKRIGKDYIKVEYFGQESDINMALLQDQIAQIQNNWEMIKSKAKKQDEMQVQMI